MTWYEHLIALAVASGTSAKIWQWYKDWEWRRALAKLERAHDHFRETLHQLELEGKLPK